jgi:ubiquinone/menaquinone biosynthesis C-methylase UbiE
MTEVTRGPGILTGFLARQRAKMADSIITEEKRDGSVLDIGCGTKPFFLINTRFREKYGIDASVEKGYSQEYGLKLFKRNVTGRLPFRECTFDVVTMLAVLEHLEKGNIADVISEVRRVLKEGGMFIITTPAKSAGIILSLFSRLGLFSREEVEEHKGLMNEEDLTRYLESAGFRSIRSRRFELGLNIVMVARKGEE